MQDENGITKGGDWTLRQKAAARNRRKGEVCGLAGGCHLLVNTDGKKATNPNQSAEKEKNKKKGQRKGGWGKNEGRRKGEGKTRDGRCVRVGYDAGKGGWVGEKEKWDLAGTTKRE